MYTKKVELSPNFVGINSCSTYLVIIITLYAFDNLKIKKRYIPLSDLGSWIKKGAKKEIFPDYFSLLSERRSDFVSGSSGYRGNRTFVPRQASLLIL